jgi:hypothetical protein
MRIGSWLVISFCLAVPSLAADVKFLYLAVSSRPVPGTSPANQPEPGLPAFGVSVFLDSDNPAVTGFRVTVEYKTSDGQAGTQTKTVRRDAKYANVTYSTLVNFLFDSSPSFTVTKIEAAAETARTVALPIPGMPYAPEE